jgi:hypothetical protein
MCESKDFIEAADDGEIPKEEHSVVLKVSKILVSPGASVNLTLATGRERTIRFSYPHPRSRFYPVPAAMDLKDDADDLHLYREPQRALDFRTPTPDPGFIPYRRLWI